MKRLLISLAVGAVLTVVFSVLAGFGGGACHCNTPLQVLFPFMSMLGVHTDGGVLGSMLWGLQFPVYTGSVVCARGPNWRAGVLLTVVVVHLLAVWIASGVS